MADEAKVAYNASIRAVEMPDRIKRLPISPKGYPVPWFVAWRDGEPDFRLVRKNGLADAHNGRKCWVCGGPMGSYKAMTVGPMCAINRVISEPPAHRECAIYSAIACPFLSNPRMQRREAGLPANLIEPAGIAIKRNPGAVAVWITRGYRPIEVDSGCLFEFDEPTEVLWFAHGRSATRQEVMASIDSGLPLLMAEAEREGPESVADLMKATAAAMAYLPAATPATPAIA